MKIALLHAWPLDERMWYPQAKVLREAGFQTVTPPLYGRGPSIDGWAAQLLRELEEPFVAVGASMGGYLALALARRAPELVLGLVLVGARAGADPVERRRLREDLIVELRAGRLPPDTDVPAQDLWVAQEAIRDRLDLTGVALSFGGPLLVCVGERDDLLGVDEARSLAEQALRGSLEVFPGAGHLPNVEQPDRFNAVLLEFVLANWR